MMFGRSWTGERTEYARGQSALDLRDRKTVVVCPEHPDHVRFGDAQRIVSNEMKLERLQRELAEAEAKANLAGVAA